MNETTFDKLEFHRIRELLASHCATAPGKKLATSLSPSTRAATVREWLEQVRELLPVVKEHGYPPLGGVSDIRDYVRAAAFPTPLEPEALARVSDTLAATGPLRAWFKQLTGQRIRLSQLAERIDDLTPIAEVIAVAIDARGQVRDDASPRLVTIRRAIEDTRRHLKTVCERLLRQPSLARMLQYAGATFHDDRAVLPLKAEYRGRIPGIVHRTSDTGATLFVEPAEAVELNNSLVRLRDQESKEITRILRALTQRVQVNGEAILSTVRAMAVLDLIAGKCRYAAKRSCICPTISDDGVLALHQARHPLLIELFDAETTEGRTHREVVPIDVRLGDDFDVLVVTGPNTGGKTVTLKTLGLLALMTQSGIPIPTEEGSQLPVYHQVFIDVGDEQSLQQSLSTFSSHLASHLEILRRSGPRSLVLIDELGAGTDPSEGAAIGHAVIAELLHLKAQAVVTTHLSDLKAVAFTTQRVDNASVEFDPQSLRPTFRLRLGEPGNSNALIIAQRLGMSPRLVKLARGYLADSTQALNRAIQGTLDSRRQAERARRTALEESRQAAAERQELERKQQEFEQRTAAFETWAHWVRQLAPGDTVHLRSLDREARVVRMMLHQQRALVSAGGMDIEVPVNDLAAPTE